MSNERDMTVIPAYSTRNINKQGLRVNDLKTASFL